MFHRPPEQEAEMSRAAGLGHHRAGASAGWQSRESLALGCFLSLRRADFQIYYRDAGWPLATGYAYSERFAPG